MKKVLHLLSVLPLIFMVHWAWAEGSSGNVVENANIEAGANVGASAPAFWSQPGDDWSWFLMPAAGIVALWFIWRALTRKK